MNDWLTDVAWNVVLIVATIYVYHGLVSFWEWFRP